MGILLISLAVISLLSLFKLTEGSLSSFFSQWILKGFGWGSYILVALIGYIGFLILLRHLEQLPRLNLGRIILLEISMFALLALLSIINGLSIDRATKGVDGGVVGWGLGRIVRDFVGFPIAVFMFSCDLAFILYFWDWFMASFSERQWTDTLHVCFLVSKSSILTHLLQTQQSEISREPLGDANADTWKIPHHSRNNQN